MKKNRPNQSGFTLMELLVTIGMVAIASAISTPLVRPTLASYQLKGAARDIVSHFQLTRMEAVRRNASCSITFNQTVGGTDYDYIAYVDADNDRIYDSGEEILNGLQVNAADSGDVIFDPASGASFTRFDDHPSVSFSPRGLPGEGGTVSLSNSYGTTKTVSLTPAGGIRIQ